MPTCTCVCFSFENKHQTTQKKVSTLKQKSESFKPTLSRGPGTKESMEVYTVRTEMRKPAEQADDIRIDKYGPNS